MNRKEFLQTCAIFGIGLPVQNVLSSCQKEEIQRAPFAGKVLIIGAGAGGLSAGYFLHQQGVDFQILEASAIFGGRMRINNDFADFPIPLGAEWLETDTGIFQEIVNDQAIEVKVDTVPDAPDRKFVNYSWFNFFEDYIVPPIAPKISFNTVVKFVDFSGDSVVVRTENEDFIADKVIMAVPLQILKEQLIKFTPALPSEKQNAIDKLIVWEGFKAFFEFKTNFYGNEEYEFNIGDSGQKIYYNAALGQNTGKHILGLFAVGAPAKDFITLTDDELKNFVLDELDAHFGQKARPNYLKHISQNWNKETYIRGGYLSDHADWKTVKILGESIDKKLYFTGGEFTDGEDWVSVHTAARSAKRTAMEVNS